MSSDIEPAAQETLTASEGCEFTHETIGAPTVVPTDEKNGPVVASSEVLTNTAGAGDSDDSANVTSSSSSDEEPLACRKRSSSHPTCSKASSVNIDDPESKDADDSHKDKRGCPEIVDLEDTESVSAGKSLPHDVCSTNKDHNDGTDHSP